MVSNGVTIPALPCRDLDETVSFYEALGFSQTYRQRRPNPYAAVRREAIEIHLFSVQGFDPEQSHGNVIVVVPDPDDLYLAFANGLRAAYGKLPRRASRASSGPVRGLAPCAGSASSIQVGTGCACPGWATRRRKPARRGPLVSNE
jgi:catechol 2,3-dioxygenase-like lactoylglutathione lyase family enzyme